MLPILLALILVYMGAFVIWSASGRDYRGMAERKIGQIAMGLVVMVVMAQIPPRVCMKAAGRPISISFASFCWLPLMPSAHYPRARSAGSIWGIVRQPSSEIAAKNRRAADGRPFY